MGVWLDRWCRGGRGVDLWCVALSSEGARVLWSSCSPYATSSGSWRQADEYLFTVGVGAAGCQRCTTLQGVQRIGTWNVEPVSIFTTTSFDLRSIYCDQGEEELPPCLPPHRTASSCLMCGSLRGSRGSPSSMTAPLEAALCTLFSIIVAGDRD